MDNRNDETMTEALAHGLVERHGSWDSLILVERIRKTCITNSHPQVRHMAAFWAQVSGVIQDVARSEGMLLIRRDHVAAPGDSPRRSVDDTSEAIVLSEIDRHVGRRLRSRRREKGLPIHVLARSLGLSPGELERVEAGQQRLDAETFMAALRVLDIDAAYLLRRDAGCIEDDPDDDASVH